MKKDNLFNEPIDKQFEFDDKVAAVFDDMIDRSVPFYKENLELIVKLLQKRLKPGMRLVDLGCSTGALLIQTARRVSPGVELIGIDNAPAMIETAKKKAAAMECGIDFRCVDLMAYDFGPCDIVVANYTLQFIRPLIRHKAVQKIYDALKPGGLFICSEKVLMEDKWLDRAIIEIYYDYKKSKGYSETQIMRKREALENVLIPYTIQENRKMFLESGFKSVDTVFQWANFAAFVAAKRE